MFDAPCISNAWPFRNTCFFIETDDLVKHAFIARREYGFSVPNEMLSPWGANRQLWIHSWHRILQPRGSTRIGTQRANPPRGGQSSRCSRLLRSRLRSSRSCPCTTLWRRGFRPRPATASARACTLVDGGKGVRTCRQSRATSKKRRKIKSLILCSLCFSLLSVTHDPIRLAH